MSNTQRPKEVKTLTEANAARMANPLVAAIMAAQDIPYEDVSVPEWGGVKLRIRGLDGRERDRYEAKMATFRASMGSEEMRLDLLDNRNAALLALCLFDPETDERVPISADMLGRKSGTVVQRLARIALRLSGLSAEASEDAGKDSENDPSESSTTD